MSKTMTINSAILEIERNIREILKDQSLSWDGINRLKAAKQNLEAIKSASIKKDYLIVPDDLKDLLNSKYYTNEIAVKIDGAVISWQEAIEKAGSINVTTGSVNINSKKGKLKNVDFWFPILVAVIVLAIGLSLGLTIFAERQDALYFTLESIKDILGSIMAGLTANQAINAKKNKRNNTAIIIIGTIVGLFALVFAIVLWIGANLAVIERFTNWSKLTYLWTSITISLISIICTVCIVWYLLSYQPRYKEKGRNIL